MKGKRAEAALCVALGVGAAWAIPYTVALQGERVLLTNSTALFLIALTCACAIGSVRARYGTPSGAHWALGGLFAAMLVIGAELYQNECLTFSRQQMMFGTLAILFLASALAHGVLALETACAGARDALAPCPSRPAALVFIGCWAFIWLCWAPAFLAYFPAITSYDTGAQLRQIASGDYVSNHPLVHTLFISLCIRLGGSARIGMVVYAAVQMLFLSAVFACVLTAMRTWRVPRAIWLSALLWYALCPTNALLAITVTKDVFFSGCFILCILAALRAVREGKAFFQHPGRIGGMVALLCITCLLRHNGVAALAALAVGLFLVLPGSRVRALCMCAASLCLYIAASTALSSALKAAPGGFDSLLSVPVQQVAAAVNAHPERIDESERAALDTLFGEDGLSRYMSYLADPVKGRMRQDVLAQNPMRYLSLYLSIGRKCPANYLSAALALNAGMWYPDNALHATGRMQTGIGYVETIDYFDWPGESLDRPGWLPGVHALYEAFASEGDYRHVGVLSILFSPGMSTWALLLGTFILARDGRRRWIAAFAPAWGMLLILLLSPTVSVRYAYPIMISIPLLGMAIFAKCAAQEEMAGRVENN